ncbi:MAG TPA: OmpA family protein [Candidatus Eisenbacteria bacterium]|nr:OmpA family protein [Candidatus Eisenbacteria bacterium]
MHAVVRLLTIRFVVALLATAALPLPSHAGPFDKLKKKVEKKASEKADQAIDKAGESATGREAEGGEPASEAAGETPAPKGAAGGTVSSVSTKFDFVSGDSVILWDDFTQDELGEFPAKWRLSSGTFEVAETKGERWLRCTSDDGHIRMKAPPALPEYWTLELDVQGTATGAYLTVSALSADGATVWEATYPHSGKNLAFRCGDIFSTTPVEGEPAARRHTVMFMGRGNSIKAYMDRERVANVPDVTGRGAPAEFDFRLWAPGMPVKLMITNVRFAEGCRPAKDLLAEGKLVTYGIHFKSGSDVVEAESAPVLRQIAAYLESKPEVRLKITGHTDNVGKPADNLDLSKRRAASVAAVLASQFRIAADRFQTDGKGDTQAVSSNAKPEGRAMNRRVEFAKIEG